MSWSTPSDELGAHICIQLIELVKKYPVLYLSSKASAPYLKKSRTELNNIWNSIAREIGLPAEDCKRRWKSLRDVYSKIRKRRLQETALGISNRRNWIYEDVMSFIKFPFEKSYQKALDNFEDIDINEWQSDKTENTDMAEDISNDSNDRLGIEDRLKVQDMKIEYLDLDLEVDPVPDSEGFEATHNIEKDDDSLENRTSVHISMLEENPVHNTEVKPRSRYRAIRPRPYQPNLLSKNKSIQESNAGPKDNASPKVSQTIVSNQVLKRVKNYDTMIAAIKVQNYANESRNDVSSTSRIEKELDSSNQNTRIQSSITLNKNQLPLQSLPIKKISTSLELFFQSMALTVMNLPMQAQAEIKMEICRLVTKAEIQYSVSGSKSNLEFQRSENTTS